MQEKEHILIFGGTSTIAQALIPLIEARGGQCSLAARDASDMLHINIDDAQTFSEAANQAEANKGPITGIVNCIGSILLKPAHLLTDQEWKTTLNTNLTSSFYVVREAAKCMLKRGGSIVLMSTAATHIGLPNHEAIAAAKAGINGLMQSAAATYASNQLRFNCVAPGLVETRLSEKITGNARALEVSLKAHPLGRVGQADEIARMLAFLLDPQNSWITGQVIAIDGGLSSLKSLG